jgi:integrase/recombinase XerD
MDIQHYVENFSTYLFRLGYAAISITTYKASLKRFLGFLHNGGIQTLQEVLPCHIQAYNEYLHGFVSNRSGLGVGGATIQKHITVVKTFAIYIGHTEQINIFNTSVDIVPSIVNTRKVISIEKVKLLYNETTDTVTGLKDSVILGLCYGCGLRYSEAIRVLMNHIDYQKRLLYVLPSKNYKSRYVPISNTVLKDFKNYELYSRKHLLIWKHKKPVNNKDAFIQGAYSNSSLNIRLKKLCSKAGIEDTVTLHVLRHSIATHLLQSGMNIEQIAKFLGHTTLRATQIYTHIAAQL